MYTDYVEIPPFSPKIDDRITELHGQLSPKHKRLARFILNNKYFMSFASAHQAGERTGTSAATVVRFAQTLGYEGYAEMQRSIRAELPSYLRAMDRLKSHLESPEEANGMPENVFQTDISNIQRTARNLSKEKLDAATQALANAQRILVVGTGLSSSAAVFLAHSLKIIGLDARLNTNEGLSLASELAGLRQGDLLVAIDLWRYVRSTVSAVRKARTVGAHVIAITDSIVSPLAETADYAFEVVTEGVAHSLSAAALMSFLNVLIAALSYHLPEQTLESIQRIDSAYRENDLLHLE
jgi:DNA-binding MurR/RpiR family transcriptional regulator